MRIGKRLFPYPTINNSKNISAFESTNYSLTYDELMYEDENFVIKNACIKIDNENILKLMNLEKLAGSLIIECSSTVFRKTFQINTVPKDIFVPLVELRNKIEVSCYIYATEDFDFVDDDFLEDYCGYTFEIEKYDIIAIDDGFTTRIEYDEENDNKISSIFSIIAKEDIDTEIFQVEKAFNKIFIYMSEDSLKKYDSLKRIDVLQNTFFAIIIVPALISVLQELQTEIKVSEKSLDEIKIDYKWFETIEKAYADIYKTELTTDLFIITDIVELAQKLINNATINSINDTFINTFSNSFSGGDEDE